MVSWRSLGIGAYVAAVVSVSCALAGDPLAQTFTYQGRLSDRGGLVNGTHNVSFSLYATSVGGVAISTVDFPSLGIADGLFTVNLDFGAGAFNGDARWLQITVDGTPLSPRQPVVPSPYALRSFATRGLNVSFDDQVGINTTVTQPAELQIATSDQTYAIYATHTTPAGGNAINAESTNGIGVFGLHNATTGFNPGVAGFTNSTNGTAMGVWGRINSTAGGAQAAGVLGSNNTTTSAGYGVAGNHSGLGVGVYGESEGGIGVEGFSDGINGVGVSGTTSGSAGFGGVFVNSSGFGLYVGGAENNGTNASMRIVSGAQTMFFDGNEIDSNSTAGLYLNNNNTNNVNLAAGGGNVVLAAGGGDVSMTNSASVLDVAGSIEAGVGIFGFQTAAGPYVRTRAASDAGVTRTHIRFEATGSVGSITSLNGAVSYNAFTGSHYVTSSVPLSEGQLVRMTGVNARLRDDGPSEVVYGVEPSWRANDPACLGAFLGAHGDLQTSSGESISLVAAVGNGELWVVDDGRGGIEPGDLLIASDVAGCAMKDDPARFAVGHIVARAAERVAWEHVEADEIGVRRAMVSVLFEPHTRRNGAEQQQAEIEALRAELESLRQAVSTLQKQSN